MWFSRKYYLRNLFSWIWVKNHFPMLWPICKVQPICKSLFSIFAVSKGFQISENECVKLPMHAHQVLIWTGYIFEASFSTSVTLSMDQLELLNLWAGIGTLTYRNKEISSSNSFTLLFIFFIFIFILFAGLLI